MRVEILSLQSIPSTTPNAIGYPEHMSQSPAFWDESRKRLMARMTTAATPTRLVDCSGVKTMEAPSLQFRARLSHRAEFDFRVAGMFRSKSK